MIKESLPLLNRQTLTDIAFGINGAGGGGNVLELYNPENKFGIKSLVEEIGDTYIPLLRPSQLSPQSMVCCVARLGSPGAKADKYAYQGSQALVTGLTKLCDKVQTDFPKAIFPVEATAGQMARAIRSVTAASKTLNKDIAILDGDLCGGLAVPAIPLAFKIYKSLKRFPTIALIELLPDQRAVVKPNITLLDAEDPEVIEDELRKLAGKTPLGAVWFAWLLSPAGAFTHYFTEGAVSNSMRRGAVVKKSVERGKNPAIALKEAGEIEEIVAQGIVNKIKNEEVAGFKQISYKLETKKGEIEMSARNEYIIVNRGNQIVARAPHIICALNQSGPIQSHVLAEGDEISVVVAKPQSLINDPDGEKEWSLHWQRYWRAEQNKGLWVHPY